MDFYSPATLSFSSTVTVIATLYCHEDLKYLLKQKRIKSGWQEIVCKITNYVSQLPLPQTTKNNLIDLVLPIGKEIRNWLIKHEYALKGGACVHGKFSWTPLGLLDSKNTAVNILEDDKLEDIAAFKLAGIHCLENHVTQICRRLQGLRVVRFDNNCCIQFKANNGTFQLTDISRWVTYMISGTDKFTLSDSPGHCDAADTIFKECVVKGDIAAAAYFLERVDPIEREILIRNAAGQVMTQNRRNPFNPAKLIFLLSQLSKKQQDAVFAREPLNILHCFQEWPLCKFFIELTDRMWVFLPLEEFYVTVVELISRTEFGEVLTFRNLFREFWLRSPALLRTQCISKFIFPVITSLFQPFNHDQVLKSLCNDSNACEKLRQNIFSNPDSVLQLTLEDHKGKAVKSVIQQCFPSAVEKNGFDEQYQEYIHMYCTYRYYGDSE